MIDEKKLREIANAAAMIVDGYAFTPMGDGNISVLALFGTNNACVIREDGEVLETNMDDIELAIVDKYWQRNRYLMKEEEQHA